MPNWRKAVVVAATVALTSVPLAAHAEPAALDITDPSSVMSYELLKETSSDLPELKLSASDSSFEAELTHVPEDESLAASIPESSDEGTFLAPTGEASGSSLKITAPFDDVVPTLDDSGITVFDDPMGHAATFIQPLDDGLRYLTAIGSEEAGNEFSYVIEGAEGGYLQKVDEDQYALLSADDDYIATVQAPWAVDSSGQELDTSYAFEGSTLTQTVSYESDTQFPVLADPTWYYSVDHRSYNVITGKEKAGAARAINELNRCFNCSFPVSGAPAYFPALGARINLNASPITLIKVAAPVQMSTRTATSFSFIALAGHFDGAGSTVNFNFYNDASGWLHILVSAKVLKDRGWAANEGNKTVASETWLSFLGNLIRQRTL